MHQLKSKETIEESAPMIIAYNVSECKAPGLGTLGRKCPFKGLPISS